MLNQQPNTPHANTPSPSSTYTKQLPIVVAELCITILGVSALFNGIDGAIFATTVAALAGLGGYHIKAAPK